MFDLTLSPAQVELLAKPGTTITQGFDITNNSSSPMMVKTSVRSWLPIGNNGLVTYANVDSNPNFQFSLANANIQLGQTFILRAGEKQQLVLKLKSSDTTPLTDSYFTFFVSQDTTNTISDNQTGAQTSAEIGAHILISTSTTESVSAKASVSRFSAAPKIKDIFFTPITFSGIVNNESDHFFKTDGQITISKNGKVIKDMTLFPHNILANHSRQINCLQDNEPVNCTFNPPFWPGAYTATINTNHTTDTISFFVFPLYFVILMTIIVLIASFVLKLSQVKTTS